MTERDNENKHFAIIVCCLLALLIMAIADLCKAGGKQNIASAILWTVSDTDNTRIYRGTNNTEAFKSAEYREELAHAFETAGANHGIPPMLLVAMAYYETVYRDQTGDEGRSRGIMQVGIMGRTKCYCNMDTAKGQIECGACWLSMGKDWCGSLEGGLYAYINGSCTPKNVRARRAFNIRKRMQGQLEERFSR